MKVALIGGGIGGLVAALYLHREGIACRIYEAAREFKPLGVGINLLPHAMRRLSELGVEPGIRRRGVEPKEFVWFNQHGQLIFQEPAASLNPRFTAGEIVEEPLAIQRWGTAVSRRQRTVN